MLNDVGKLYPNITKYTLINLIKNWKNLDKRIMRDRKQDTVLLNIW